MEPSLEEQNNLLREENNKLIAIVTMITGNDGFLCGRLHGHPPFTGGCGKAVDFMDAYRCADCNASFHRDCIRLHFASHGEALCPRADCVQARQELQLLREKLRVEERPRCRRVA